MRVVRTIPEMRVVAERLRRRHRTVGLVPTMGALHEGHASLIRTSASRYGATIVTIFVNPLQFGPGEGYRRYPRDLAQDVRRAAANGADVVFVPGAPQMYPAGFQTAVEIGELAARWEGRSRPGHFRGVATVVVKLLDLIQPTHAVFGQKDYQQALVIRRLIQDLNLPVAFQMLPTVREPGGLAMSSRNRSLSVSERRQATVLYRALDHARGRIRSGVRHAPSLIAQMRHMIDAQPAARVDYVAIVDAKTLRPQARLHGRVAILVAACVGRARLIDNLLVEVS